MMNYCGPRGIPYGSFLAWDDLSQSAALAWSDREGRRCKCGEIRDEWMGYDADGEPIINDDGVHMEARVPPKLVAGLYCPACAAIDRASKGDHSDNRAWNLHLIPNPAAAGPPD